MSHSATAAAYLSGVDLTGLAPEQALRLQSLVAELLELAEVSGYRKAITALRDEAQRQNEGGSLTSWAVHVAAADYLEAIAEEGTNGATGRVGLFVRTAAPAGRWPRVLVRLAG